MIEAREILERRLLAALESTARAGLPAPWSRLRPERDDSLRPASAVLLRLAQLPGRAEMVVGLRRTAKEVGERRGGRAGGERELWEGVAAALERVGEVRPGTQGLFGLALWGPGVPLAALQGSLHGLRPGRLEPDEPFLTAAARTLLRALARSWTETARRKERKEGGS